jgi:membrane protein
MTAVATEMPAFLEGRAMARNFPRQSGSALRIEIVRRPKSRLKTWWDGFKELLAESVAGWNRHNAPRLGAALAYYTLLSLAPLLLVLISIAGLVFGSRAGEQHVIEQIQFLLGAQRATIIADLLAGAQNKAEGIIATIAGALVLLFGATGVVVELRDALNSIWDVPVRTTSTFQELLGVVKDRLWSLALVLGMVVVLTVSLLVTTAISALGAMTSFLPAQAAMLHLFNSFFSFVATAIVFGALYKVVPQVPVRCRDVVLGAVLTAVLFALGNFLLGVYLGKTSFSSTYGAASSTVALAIWVYYSSQIFFLGAEFTRAYTGGPKAGKKHSADSEPAQSLEGGSKIA